MSRVVHVVVTDNFAGAERYVSNVANETAGRGWAVTVVGGHRKRMREALESPVRWLPGSSPFQALRSLVLVGRQDVCHVHMTHAEAVGLAARPAHRAAVVSTRHFASARGSSLAGRALAPLIASRVRRELAVSEFVAQRLERAPDAVIVSGVPASPLLWREDSRVVLVMQRLEPEKDTLTALRAWEVSGFADAGWSLRIVGSGSERSSLESFVHARSMRDVRFAGWTTTVSAELARAGILLATSPADALGLGVLEAMASGVPVVACAAGGHLETLGLLPQAPMFPPGDAPAAASAMRRFLEDDLRVETSRRGRGLVGSAFSLERHVDRLLEEYAAATRDAAGA